jgi:hypothetical protein
MLPSSSGAFICPRGIWTGNGITDFTAQLPSPPQDVTEVTKRHQIALFMLYALVKWACEQCVQAPFQTVATASHSDDEETMLQRLKGRFARPLDENDEIGNFVESVLFFCPSLKIKCFFCR